MARVLVVCHAYDAFRERQWLLQSMFPHWLAQGHEIRVCEGPPSATAVADIVFLHVDCSLIPEAYLEAVQRFPRVINGRVDDIRKSTLSRLRIAPEDGWQGPVIVKSALNCGGVPETWHNTRARQLGQPEPHPGARVLPSYPIYRHVSEVPPAVWTMPSICVEKFLPDQDARGYWTHFWLFFGDRGRCRRFCSPNPVVKAGNAVLAETVAVPASIRAERDRIGLDYGKIDFVIHGGEAIVVDVNRTPGPTPVRGGPEVGTPELLAPGLDDLLDGPWPRW